MRCANGFVLLLVLAFRSSPLLPLPWKTVRSRPRGRFSLTPSPRGGASMPAVGRPCLWCPLLGSPRRAGRHPGRRLPLLAGGGHPRRGYHHHRRPTVCMSLLPVPRPLCSVCTCGGGAARLRAPGKLPSYTREGWPLLRLGGPRGWEGGGGRRPTDGLDVADGSGSAAHASVRTAPVAR